MTRSAASASAWVCALLLSLPVTEVSVHMLTFKAHGLPYEPSVRPHDARHSWGRSGDVMPATTARKLKKRAMYLSVTNSHSRDRKSTGGAGAAEVREVGWMARQRRDADRKRGPRSVHRSKSRRLSTVMRVDRRFTRGEREADEPAHDCKVPVRIRGCRPGYELRTSRSIVQSTKTTSLVDGDCE